MSEVTIIEGDCFVVLARMEDASVHAVCCDPPYGLEFMGADWDAPWKTWEQPGGFSSPGIGDRPTQWPSYGMSGSTANATCATCGGRMRGAKKCVCEVPEWKPTGPSRDGSQRSGAWGAGDPRQAARALQEWNGQWLAECLRVLKPGGFLLAFSGTRTYHRLACAAEDVGFEVRDMIEWFYGSGFPKSKNVSLAIDEHLGKAAEREVVGQKHAERYPNGPGGTSFTVNGDGDDGTRTAERTVETRAATPEAEKWEGWGTALKPAHEPILLARKPVVGTVARNVLEHGTGGLNVDAARIATDDSLGGGAETGTTADQKGHEGWTRPWMSDESAREEHAGRVRGNVEHAESVGRWPSNVILTHSSGCVLLGTREVKSDGHYPSARGEGGVSTSGHGGQDGLAEAYMDGEVVEVYECELGCPVAALDMQSGDLKAGGKLNGSEPSQPFSGAVYGEMRDRREWGGYGDKGGASRFFYVAKASRAEREAGLGELELRPFSQSNGGKAALERGDEEYHEGHESIGMNTVKMRGNNHPTVKPIQLMRYLLRLVTPPGGVALDPFLGSGTTACAAALEDFDLIGIERDPGFVEIARRRHAFWAEHGERALEEMRQRESAVKVRQEVLSAGQLDLFD